MREYIIRDDNNKYIVIQSKEKPLNAILFAPTSINGTVDFKLINVNIDFIWRWARVYISVLYKEVNLQERIGHENLLLVCDLLHKYEAMTIEEVEIEYKNKLKVIKTDLEKDVEALKQKKSELKEEITIYREIKHKQEEINKLISQLDDKKSK